MHVPRPWLASSTLTLLLLGLACGRCGGPECGPGTHDEDGTCVPDPEGDTDTDSDSDSDSDADADADADTDADADADADADSDADADADTDADTDPVTVSDVQRGYASGVVTLEDVIATSDFVTALSGFFIQDQGGGAWSGVYVYTSRNDVDVFVGDRLTLTGEVQEYYDLTEIVVASASLVRVTGSGTPVATTLASAPADWESWEGCLVTLQDLAVTAGPNDYGEGETDYDLLLDDMFYHWYDDVAAGDSLSRATGAVTYTYDAYKLEPRSADDLVP